MAILDDLINKVEDPVLRDRLKKEVHKATKHKKFGLVFEEHLPECTPLYDMPIKRGTRVAPRDTEIKETFRVKLIDGDNVLCVSDTDKSERTFGVNEIMAIAEFGEPIYPYLQTVDTVCNAPDSDLWHTLIEADNYHALQLLEYMYAGQVDCIYIDPPYNKEDSKDWKYNCNYVDGNDMYRHSKWLSMMERRLDLAKKLLNPKDSVLIVTIDELEYLHLGMLLERMFPEANMQMISSVISQNGTTRQNEFSRVNEFIYILRFGNMSVKRTNDNMLSAAGKGVISRTWYTFSRTQSPRAGTPKQFYPIFIDPIKKRIVSIGDSMASDADRNDIVAPEGQIAVFPLKNNGEEVTWGAIPETTREFLKKGYLRVGEYDKKNDWWTIQYVRGGDRQRIEEGKIIIKGKREDGSLILEHLDASKRLAFPKTVWNRVAHDATVYGTGINTLLMPDRKFPFPKSLYAVEDTLRFFVSDKPNALIVDFFAGSGTTAHAVMMLNHLDSGHRRSISITNNEIGVKAEKQMRASGFRPGDKEWEEIGIAQYNTWPRIKAAITGKTTLGNQIKGKYKFTEEFNMSDGLSENAIFFKLGFLDKNAVALGRQFKELLSVLWMKAGAIGPCPHLAMNATIPDMMILPENKMAILINDVVYAEFETELQKHPEIETVYIVTDSDRGYREMARSLNVEHTYQLYRDYLDNFRINHRR